MIFSKEDYVFQCCKTRNPLTNQWVVELVVYQIGI